MASMCAMYPFRKLQVWDRAVKRAARVLALTPRVADKRADVLSAQLWRASSSVSANIAEGSAHDSHSQFARYLGMAIGSANEVESHLALAAAARIFDVKECDQLADETRQIRSMLWALREKVRSDPRRRVRPKD
jgi:four helix bundle protein